LLSCSDDSNPSEPAPEHFAIAIYEFPEDISAITGTTQEVSFYIGLKRDDDTVVENEAIIITDATGTGSVTPDEAITDEVGEVNAAYSVEMPSEPTTARIRVEANNQTVSENISLYPIRRPTTIRFESDRRFFAVGVDTAAEVPFEAIVTDENGQVIPGVHVSFSLESAGNQEVFGSVTNSGITDSLGRATTTFRSYNQYGGVVIIARVDEPGFEEEIICSSRLEIRSKPAGYTIRICTSPDEFNISQISPWNTTYISQIFATVTDSTGVGIPLTNLQLSTTHGRINEGLLYFNPETDMEGNEPLIIVITGYIPGVPEEGRAQIQVNVLNDLPILTLGTDKYVIKADGPGGSQTILNVTLAAPEGLPIPNEEIVIRGTENTCVIQSPVVTDSMGRATAIFDDLEQPGIVTVIAESRFGDSNGIDILVQEHISKVDRIELFSDRVLLGNIPDDSVRVRAICYLENGRFATDGTIVQFEARRGSFAESIVVIEGVSGAADTYYYSRGVSQSDYIFAYVVNEGDTTESNGIEIRIHTGPPSLIILHASPNELMTNNPWLYSTITATLLDSSMNPVRGGTRVRFETTLGTISQSGETSARLYPGRQAGLAVVTGFIETPNDTISGQATVRFVASTPEYIELTTDRLFAEVRARYPVTLRAIVRDGNGNLIECPTPVVFEMINEPEPPTGCTIGNIPNQQAAVYYTSNGVATTFLNPGTQIGGKLIRAYTWRDSAAHPDDIITTTFAGFAVVSGPPFQLEIGISDIGEDAGGGAWAIEVSARVWDIHRNPVQNRIPVVFSVEPEIANIEAAWTGNENRNGEIIPGLAFATLVYNSVNSLDNIEISAEVQTERGQIQHSIDHILPVQGGVLLLEEAGGDFVFDDENEVIEVRFNALLFDGHQIRIENAPFIFTADFGVFDPDQPGRWTASEEDIFFNPDINEQQVRFRVRVDGTDIVSEPLEIVVRRR